MSAWYDSMSVLYLQVSVCSGYDLFHFGYHPDTHRDRRHLTSLYDKLSQLS